MAIPAFLILLFGKCPKIGGKPKPEDAICLELARRLRKWTLKEQLSCVWCHVTNEFAGVNSPIYGALKTAIGRVKGAADYFFLGATGSFVIEIKVPKKKQSPHQIAFQFWCESVGVRYYLAYSADEAEAILRRECVIKDGLPTSQMESPSSTYTPRTPPELLPKE